MRKAAMMIEKFLQGQETDARLFGLIGKVALSAKVHRECGNAISSEDGDLWIVSTRPSDVADGFVQMRASSTTVHLRFCYSTKASIKIYMVKEAIKKAREIGALALFTNERKDDDVFPKLGFVAVNTKRRGSFVRWELTL